MSSSSSSTTTTTTTTTLGGSWIVITGVISRVTMIIAHIRRLIPLLITTHEPASGFWIHYEYWYYCDYYHDY